MKLVKAEKKDFPRVNELFIEMLQTIYNTNEVQGYNDGDLHRFFQNDENWICLVLDQEKIIAFLSIEVHREDSDFLYLDDFSVTSDYRKKGVGTLLLNKAEEYAKEVNVNAIRLHIEKTNASAKRLYERLGYEILEDQDNRLLMVKYI